MSSISLTFKEEADNLSLVQPKSSTTTIRQQGDFRYLDLHQKKRDFMHLLFNESNADRILQFSKVVACM